MTHLKVLIVEDDQSDRASIERVVLRNPHCQVDTADSVAAACSKLSGVEFLILDIQLPPASGSGQLYDPEGGLKVLQCVTQLPDEARPFVVVLSQFTRGDYFASHRCDDKLKAAISEWLPKTEERQRLSELLSRKTFVPPAIPDSNEQSQRQSP
jgi:CheY-like chemotaxis protein